jgi:hypothetical protein
MQKKGCCRECKYADWDADGCTCMIDGRSVYNASDYTCDQYRPAKPLTNADRIRQMTDEELIELVNSSVCHYVTNCLDNDCEECGRKWVMKEVSEDDKR